MSDNIVQSTSHKAVPSSFDALAPLSSRALFWRAGYVADSPFLEHVPLLFWIVENARPGMVVSLGVADAVPYFAACQAIDKLNLETICYGIETDAEADLNAVRAHNARNFQDFSQIVIGDRTEIEHAVQNAQIDFLIVNEALTPALADEIDRSWLPVLSDNAVVLFAKGGDAAVLPKYADRIAVNGGVFTADTFRGVRLALRGSAHNERLMRLTRLAPGRPGYMSVRHVFARMGELHRTSFDMRQATSTLGNTRKQRDKALLDLKDKDDQLADGKARLAEVTGHLNATGAQIATMRSEEFDSRAALEDLNRDLAESASAQEGLRKTISQLEAEQEASKAAEAALNDQCAALRRERDEMTALAERHSQELATLVRALEARDQELEQQQADMQSLRKRFEQLEETHRQDAATAMGLRHKCEELKAARDTADANTDQRFKELAKMAQLLEERDRQLHEKARALQAASNDLKHAQLHHRIVMHLVAAKEEILITLHARRTSGRYRALRSESNRQVAEIEHSDLFDAVWYCETYPDIAASPLSPAEHFVRSGAYEGRNPGPRFDTMKYHMANPEVAAHKMPALVHYLRHGKAEGRQVFAVTS